MSGRAARRACVGLAIFALCTAGACADDDAAEAVGGARASGAFAAAAFARPGGRRAVAVGAIDADHDDAYEYRLPYADGVSYPVIQGYGERLSHRGPEHFTVDFRMPVGTPVHAAREGIVVLVEDRHDGGCWRAECGRLANFVVVLHADGTTGEYFHLERGSARVRPGQHVRRGERLAASGNTGYSTTPHLHFGVYRTARDGRTESLAVRFVAREGPIAAPRSGARYRNAASR